MKRLTPGTVKLLAVMLVLVLAPVSFSTQPVEAASTFAPGDRLCPVYNPDGSISFWEDCTPDPLLPSNDQPAYPNLSNDDGGYHLHHAKLKTTSIG